MSSKNRFGGGYGSPVQATPKPAIDPLDRAAQALKEQPFPFESFKPGHAENHHLKGSAVASSEIKEEQVETMISGGVENLSPVYMEVDIDQIDDNPFNARAIYLPEKISEKAADIKLRGQLVPGLAVKKGDRFQLIAGHYRKRALPLAGLNTMKLMVYPQLSEQQLYILSYKENDEANPQTNLDNALRWRALLDQKIFQSEIEIAESIGMSKSNVNKTLQILNLSPEVLEIIEQDPGAFALSTLYELVLLNKVAGARETAMVTDAVLHDGWGRKNVAERRAALEKGGAAQRRRNETSRKYNIVSGDDRIGAIKEWDNGKVMLEVTALNPEARVKLVEDLKRMFTVKD